MKNSQLLPKGCWFKSGGGDWRTIFLSSIIFLNKKNGVKNPPKSIHIRTDLISVSGHAGATTSLDYSAEKEEYVISIYREFAPKTTVDLR